MTLRIDPQQGLGTRVVRAERGIVKDDGRVSDGAEACGEEDGRSPKPRLTPDLLIYQRCCIEIESVNGACMEIAKGRLIKVYMCASCNRHSACCHTTPLLQSLNHTVVGAIETLHSYTGRHTAMQKSSAQGHCVQ